MSDPAELYNAILTGNAKKADEITKAALRPTPIRASWCKNT